ncbi:MAG: PH domain-containing protein, partial [Ktedonobacteraceae bacterium]
MSKQISQFTIPEDWQPKRREHGGLRQVRRTKDRQLRFKGQDNDEEVKMVVRQHPLFLLKPAGPVLGVLVLFLLPLALGARFSDFAAFWLFLDVILGALLLITLGYFLWKDFFVWLVNIDIITNKRIIACRGFIHPTRKIITLDKIMQVSTDQDSPASIFLEYGDVHIYLSGGKHVMKDVPKPREVRDAVDGIFQEFKAAKPAEKLPPLADPEIHTVIARLGKKEERPTLPDADVRYSHRRKPEHLRRPLRRFGGPFQIPAEVTYA